jgi:quinol monooxygenase YgiN
MPIVMTAKFQAKAEKLSECERAIREFIDYIHANEPGTLLYVSARESGNPTRFLHYFAFRDEQARQKHSNSEAVKRFTGILYPNLTAPVEFTEYVPYASTAGE